MKAAIAAELLLATATYALPEISIAKKHRHGVKPITKRQTVGTTIFNIITYSTGGAYYANSRFRDPGIWDEGLEAKRIMQSRLATLRKSKPSSLIPAHQTSTLTPRAPLPARLTALTTAKEAPSHPPEQQHLRYRQTRTCLRHKIWRWLYRFRPICRRYGLSVRCVYK